MKKDTYPQEILKRAFSFQELYIKSGKSLLNSRNKARRLDDKKWIPIYYENLKEALQRAAEIEEALILLDV